MFTPRVIGTAVARYNFAARDMRELSLREGDVVKIYSRIGGDQGWWKGETNGRVSAAGPLPLGPIRGGRASLRHSGRWARAGWHHSRTLLQHPLMVPRRLGVHGLQTLTMSPRSPSEEARLDLDPSLSDTVSVLGPIL